MYPAILVASPARTPIEDARIGFPVALFSLLVFPELWSFPAIVHSQFEYFKVEHP